MEKVKPKIGVALSGGAGRAVAHFGVLDVLRENGINPDIVVGCSSGALVAVAYGAGTRDFLMDIFNNMDKKRLWSLWSWRGSRGGLFHLHKAKKEFEGVTRNLNFEDLSLKIGVTAADIESGNLVTITKGDMTQGLKATVAVPGLFEPVVINDRILLEGGLVNIVPTIPVRQLGADIVIGVDVAKSKFFFQRKMALFRLIRRWRRLFGIHFVQQEIINPITSQIFDQIEKLGVKRHRVPNALRIFFWAVDRSYDIEEEWREENRSCDIMIQPEVKETAKLELRMSKHIYEEGRRATIEALPRIRQLIAEYEKTHQKEKVPNA